MNVTPEQLFATIGQLHVEIQMLTAQLAASRKQLVKQAEAQAADGETAAEPEPEAD